MCTLRAKPTGAREWRQELQGRLYSSVACKILAKTWRHAGKDEIRAENRLCGEEKIFTPEKQVSFD
jgi:hypothetical protein